MTHISVLSKKPVVKQPAANPARVRKQPLELESKQEKTPSEIAAEKLAAMAARPDAVIVYETEKGIDAKGWDIICPEYKIFDAALKGGYGWWDLTEGAGRHLLPKPKPYKIVKITSAELKVIRAKEAEVEAAAAAVAKAAEEAKYAAYRDVARPAERDVVRAAEERKAMAAEEELASNIRLAEWHAAQAAAAKEAERQQFIAIAVEVLYDAIKAMPEYQWCHAYLVDYIADQVGSCPTDVQDPIIERICERIEAEQMLFYTPVCSPELAPLPVEPVLPPLTLAPPAPAAPAAAAAAPMPTQLQTPPDDPLEFVKQPPFVLFGALYTPVAFLNGLRMYMPAAMLDALITATMRPALPPLPPPSPPPPATPSAALTKECGFPDCHECYPSATPFATPSAALTKDCGFPDCHECYPPPTTPVDLPLPTPVDLPVPTELPVIQAQIVPQPPKLPSNEMLKNIKIRKMRMPSSSRIQRLLSSTK